MIPARGGASGRSVCRAQSSSHQQQGMEGREGHLAPTVENAINWQTRQTKLHAAAVPVALAPSAGTATSVRQSPSLTRTCMRLTVCRCFRRPTQCLKMPDVSVPRIPSALQVVHARTTTVVPAHLGQQQAHTKTPHRDDACNLGLPTSLLSARPRPSKVSSHRPGLICRLPLRVGAHAGSGGVGSARFPAWSNR